MSVIYILLPITALLAALAVWGFIAAVRSGQFDDLEGEASRILMDEDLSAGKHPKQRNESDDESEHKESE